MHLSSFCDSDRRY